MNPRTEMMLSASSGRSSSEKKPEPTSQPDVDDVPLTMLAMMSGRSPNPLWGEVERTKPQTDAPQAQPKKSLVASLFGKKKEAK